MNYISLSDKDKKEMLDKIGISTVDELFNSVPENIKLKRLLDVPAALSELELVDKLKEISEKNKNAGLLSFLGAGAYQHYIPVVVDYLSSRGEFVSPYTPYQPEVSQGTLQVIFEFQTLICQLTGMDIANASLYDGASGAAEAVLMANRLTRKEKILVASTIHPQYRQVIQTYTQNLGLSIEEIDFVNSGKINTEQLSKKIDEKTAAVVCQSPNFFGIIEDIQTISDIAHKKNALSVYVVTEPLSLGILEPPGKLGADIVTGEAQAFGMPLSFGGPYLGFMACSKKYLRQFPGRIAGQTKDVDGKQGYVLTLSTREQHIRRERATSNICTNQALCLLRATIFLETLGKCGLRDMAAHNLYKADYARQKINEVKGIESRFSGTSFNEFVLSFNKPWVEIESSLREKLIIGGYNLQKDYPGLKNCALFCVTEMHKKEDIDKLAEILDEILRQ
jgi:glycine dehydrogenase subunit 1